LGCLQGNVGFLFGWWRISLSRETHPLRGAFLLSKYEGYKGEEKSGTGYNIRKYSSGPLDRIHPMLSYEQTCELYWLSVAAGLRI
jgi:hypothetical protein